MTDNTAAARARRQRDLRIIEGWQEVKVWVPTEADAEEIRNLAAERRANAEALHGLSNEVTQVTLETQTRIARAIADQGSAAYNTPSGAVLTLLTDLANENDLEGFSRAFVIFARAKPVNAAFVAAAVPGKVSNYLVQHRGVDPVAFIGWTATHPGWEDNLSAAVRNPARFAALIEEMVADIKTASKRH